MQQNFARGDKEVAGAQRVEHRRPALGELREAVELDVVDIQLRISLVFRRLSVSVALGDQVLGAGPVIHVVQQVEAAHLAETLLGLIDGQRLERGAGETVAEEVRLVLDGIRVAIGTLGSGVSLPHEGVFIVEQPHLGFRGRRVIDLAVGRQVFGERLLRRWLRPSRAAERSVSVVDRLREEEHIVAAQSGVGLFAGNDQEVAIREAGAAFEIDSLFLEADPAGIGGMRIGMEIAQRGDIDAERLEGGNP